jgi:hypothetical protein
VRRSKEERAERQRRRERRRLGLCSLCETLPKQDGGSWCERCAKLYREIAVERRKKGKDWDGSPIKLKRVSVAALVRERVR